jgi:hypothetical protein
MTETLYDVLQFKGEAGGKAIIDECLGTCPEVTGIDKYNGGRSFPMDYGTEASDTMETLFMTSIPEVNPFRKANEGVVPTKGTYEKRLTQLATATAYWFADIAVIEKNPTAGSTLMFQRAVEQMKIQQQALGKQFFYGVKNGGYADGFNGLIDLMMPEFVIDAGGANNTGAKLTSAYFVYWGSEGVSWRYGMNGSMTLSEPREVTKYDANGKAFPALEQFLNYYPGLQVNSKYSVGRIANIDVSSCEKPSLSKDAFTDNHIYQLLMKLPAGIKPNVVFLPYRAALLLSASRATVNVVTNPAANLTIASGVTAPTTEFDGIPFVPTDSIKIGEKKFTA